MTNSPIDVSKPIPLPSLADELKSFTDPDAIAACKDPLRRVAMVMVALSMAEGDSLTEEVKDITNDTDKIAAANDLMRMLNNAAAAAKSVTSDTTALNILTPKIGDVPADTKDYGSYQNAADLMSQFKDAGVDPGKMSIGAVWYYYGSSVYQIKATDPGPLDTAHKFNTLDMKKGDLDAATKNLQLYIDNLSSTTQQKQLFMQTLMGKYNGTYEAATAALKAMAERNANTIAGIKV
jgi:hypothetical protein